MAFVEADRVAIRHFMGAGQLFLQAYPLLESAITNIQSVADGGTRPDSSAETAVLALVSDLQLVETNLKNLWNKMLASVVDEVKIDPARGMAALRMEGRRLAFSLARHLGFDTVLADVFSSQTPQIPPVFPGPDMYSSR